MNYDESKFLSSPAIITFIYLPALLLVIIMLARPAYILILYLVCRHLCTCIWFDDNKI